MKLQEKQRRKGIVIRLYVGRELRSEKVRSLTPMERWARIALKMLVADCPYRPVLCISPGILFTDAQIAKHLMVSLVLWKQLKAKLIEWGEIEINQGVGVVYPKWLGDTGDGRARKLVLGAPSSLPTLSEKELMEDDDMRQRLMRTYNTITGGDYHHDEGMFIDAVRKRAAAGASEEDLDIALRTYLWANMNAHPMVVVRIRPYMPFGFKAFRAWRKMNNPVPCVRQESTQEYIRNLPAEKRKFARELAHDYTKQSRLLFDKMGWEHLWEVDYTKVSTCKHYIMTMLGR